MDDMKKRTNLMDLIRQHDDEQARYIAELEAKVDRLEERLSEVTSQLMSAVESNERKQLQLILAGHFDGTVSTGAQKVVG